MYVCVCVCVCVCVGIIWKAEMSNPMHFVFFNFAIYFGRHFSIINNEWIFNNNNNMKVKMFLSIVC